MEDAQTGRLISFRISQSYLTWPLRVLPRVPHSRPGSNLSSSLNLNPLPSSLCTEQGTHRDLVSISKPPIPPHSISTVQHTRPTQAALKEQVLFFLLFVVFWVFFPPICKTVRNGTPEKENKCRPQVLPPQGHVTRTPAASRPRLGVTIHHT